MLLLRISSLLQRNHTRTISMLMCPVGIPGSGAGKGGGGGGSVRESGGGLGKYGAAQEEGYFYNKQKQQLEKIKQKLKDKQGETSQKEDK